MNKDVAQLLKSVLTEMGMADCLVDDINNHSAITLTLVDGIPDINLITENDEVWLWSVLGDFNESALYHNSANLLPLMLNHHESFFPIGQPALYENNGQLELRACAKQETLESETVFTEMLDIFFTMLTHYQAALA